ncbi:MAG: AraC family transcriptional regulator [Sedimentisphaeraceae bacterium JB056]
MTNNKENFFKYFPSSRKLQDWGLYVISCGRSSILPNQPYPPEIHPEGHDFNFLAGRVLNTVTLVYIPKGGGIFESKESGKQQITAGSLFSILPGIWHRYKPDINTGWDEYWIEFDGEMATRFIKKTRLNPHNPIIKINDEAKVSSLFMEIIETAQYEPHGFEYMLSASAFSLMAILNAEMDIQKNEDIEKSDAIRKGRKKLTENLETTLDLKQLATELNMSYSLFRKTFKEITGFTPYQYRLNLKLHKAERLLRSTTLPISQIAQTLGFSSIYYFSELFKKKTTQSPLQYRKSSR